MYISYATYLRLKSLTFAEAMNAIADGEDLSLDAIDYFYNKPELISLRYIPESLFDLDNKTKFTKRLKAYFAELKEQNILNIYGMPTVSASVDDTYYGAQGDEYDTEITYSLTLYKNKFISNNECAVEIEIIIRAMRDIMLSKAFKVSDLTFEHILKLSISRYVL